MDEGEEELDVCAVAVGSGSIEALDWAIEHGFPLNSYLYTMARKDASFQVRMFRHLVEIGCPWSPQTLFYDIASIGDVELAEWALERGCTWNPAAVTMALVRRNFEFFDWAFRRNLALPFNVGTRLAAAGEAARLVRLVESNPDLYAWSSDIANAAAKFSSQLLRWTVEKGCLVGMPAVASLVKRGDLDTLLWLDDRHSWSSNYGAPGNRLWNFETIRSAPSNPAAMRYILRTGNVLNGVNCAILAHGARLPEYRQSLLMLVDSLVGSTHDHMLKAVTAELARLGELSDLEDAVRRGCPIDSNACVAAAEGGHELILEWLRDRGCVEDGRICTAFASSGNTAALIRARKRGVPWGDDTFLTTVRAAASDPEREESLYYLLDTGCPHQPSPWVFAVLFGRPQQLDRILSSLKLDTDHFRRIEVTIARNAPKEEVPRLTAVLLKHASIAKN